MRSPTNPSFRKNQQEASDLQDESALNLKNREAASETASAIGHNVEEATHALSDSHLEVVVVAAP